MKENMDVQFLCNDCTRYNLCEYYHRRKKDSYICKYFHLSETCPQESKAESEYDIEKCHTCEYAFTTGKDRWYCKKSLADKDDCREFKRKYIVTISCATELEAEDADAAKNLAVQLFEIGPKIITSVECEEMQ